jgi:hypothetical protein
MIDLPKLLTSPDPSDSSAGVRDFRPPTPSPSGDQPLNTEPMDTEPAPGPIYMGPQLPMRFIYVKHHPHANKPDEIIPLDSDAVPVPQATDLLPGNPVDRSWAPFRCLAHSTFAYRCVSRRKSNQDIDEDLKHLHGSWAENCHVTFRNHRNLEKSLDAAREGNVRVRSHLGSAILYLILPVSYENTPY